METADEGEVESRLAVVCSSGAGAADEVATLIGVEMAEEGVE